MHDGGTRRLAGVHLERPGAIHADAQIEVTGRLPG
jgi:hypothetical protein